MKTIEEIIESMSPSNGNKPWEIWSKGHDEDIKIEDRGEKFIFILYCGDNKDIILCNDPGREVRDGIRIPSKAGEVEVVYSDNDEKTPCGFLCRIR